MIKCYHKDTHVEKGLKTKYLLWIKIDGARDGYPHNCDAMGVKWVNVFTMYLKYSKPLEITNYGPTPLKR